MPMAQQNHWIQVPLWMFPVAIACGNSFVLKPSEKVSFYFESLYATVCSLISGVSHQTAVHFWSAQPCSGHHLELHVAAPPQPIAHPSCTSSPISFSVVMLRNLQFRDRLALCACAYYVLHREDY